MNEPSTLDLEHVFKLRLVVARLGEMDRLGWWNTQGMLGPYGKKALSRGFPRTHYFAQARAVFAVAMHRCKEVYDPPNAITLWNLPAEVEDQFDERWHDWLDDRESWVPFFEELAALKGTDLLGALEERDLITDVHRDQVRRLNRSAGNKAVLITAHSSPTDEALTLLAAAFARGEKSAPAIPYLRVEV